MSNDSIEGGFSLSIFDNNDSEAITKIGRGLSSPQRIAILKALVKKPMNLLELSDLLKIPLSTVSFNVDILKEANLINIEYKPALKGHMKLCSLNVTSINIVTENSFEEIEDKITIEMPVGCYTNLEAEQPYLVGSKGFIYRSKDNPNLIFTPERFKGQLFSFKNGYVIYDFPNLTSKFDNPRIVFSFEFCSEAPYYCNNWPSDITVWINDIEIGTFTSPGDFGGRRGTFTPLFWKTNSTQFGLLKTFSIDDQGTYIDDIKVTHNTINDLNLSDNKSLRLKIGFKNDAVHIGGINIFGKGFGNYAQDIMMTISNKGLEK